MGRLAVSCLDLVAPRLAEFLQPWVISLTQIKDENDQTTAFQGMYALIKANPQAAIPHFAFVCGAIATVRNPRPELAALFRELLHAYRQSAGDYWSQFIAQFPIEQQEFLVNSYGLKKKEKKKKKK